MPAATDVTVLDQDSPSLFIPAAAGQRPVVIRASGMVDADAPSVSDAVAAAVPVGKPKASK